MCKYVVITPVRNEEAYLPLTIDSVIRQTILPAEWVLVNDGSTDGTQALIDAAADRYTWIHAVHRTDRGSRAPGTGVIEAFNEGYKSLRCSDWDFVVKLDGDLSFA